MEKEELVKKLLELKVPDHMYNLEGDLPNETYCVGKNGKVWEVYYSERGAKTGLGTFKSIEDAYNHLYRILKEEVDKNYF